MKPIAFAILIASAITVATVSCNRNDEDEHEKVQLQTPEPTVSDLTGQRIYRKLGGRGQCRKL